MSKGNLYLYTGPVTSFERIIMPFWKAKAKANLMYRFKTENKRLPVAKIELPGKISLVS